VIRAVSHRRAAVVRGMNDVQKIWFGLIPNWR